jgi:exosortase
MGVDSYYSHGIIIPFLTSYLIWLKRERLRSFVENKSLLGLPLIAVAILIHVFGTVVYVYSISGFSIWIMLVGILLFLYGRDITREIFLPLLFLLFMFPVPSALITMISFPLKVLVAKVGAEIASFAGVPLLLEGFVITIPEGSLLVENPCSGLRSLIAFLVLGALFAYFSHMPNMKRVFLFLLAVPIAILSNLIRVPILVYWSYRWGLESAAPDTLVHTGSGFVVFIVGILLLGLAQRLLGGTDEN